MDAMKLLGSLMGQGGMSSGLGGNVIGQVLGGALGGGGGAAGGLGGLVSSLGGGGSEGAGGGLGGLAASLGGGADAAADSSQGGGSGMGGMAGGVIGGLAMMALRSYMQSKSQGGESSGGGGLGGLASMLGGGGGDGANALAGVNEQQANDQATVLIRAMVNAAKADGRVDASEQQRIIDRVGDAGQEEVEFLRQELSAPLDVDGFIRSVPRGLEADVYSMSLMAIELDENSEAQYLGQLASGMGLTGDQCNEIHRGLGAPEIFK